MNQNIGMPAVRTAVEVFAKGDMPEVDGQGARAQAISAMPKTLQAQRQVKLVSVGNLNTY
jgi:hypothetical protein